MTKKIILIPLIALGIIGCEKEKVEQGSSSSSIIREKLENHGFSTHQDFYQYKDGYIVEGDIYLTIEQINNFGLNTSIVLPKLTSKKSIEPIAHYRTDEIVFIPDERTIKIFLDNDFDISVENALDEAMLRYNNLNISLNFERVETSANADIRIESFFEDSPRPGSTGITLGQSFGFPTNGNPTPRIGLNTFIYNADNFRLDQATVIAHEIGHAIGFRHTDFMNRSFSCGSGGNEGNADVGAVHIEGTPTVEDNNSWMLACIGRLTDRPFTANDVIALENTYPTSSAVTSPGSASIDTKFYFADINGDGKDDKIYWNRDIFNGDIRVFLATSNGNFSGNPIISAGSRSTDTTFYFDDVNGDGKDDKIYWNRTGFNGDIRIFLATSNGDFSGNPITSAGSRSTDTTFYFDDINGDGKDDKIYWNRTGFNGDIRVFLATSNGNFNGNPITSAGSISTDTTFYFADVDGDSRDDKIYWNRTGFNGDIRVFLAASNGDFRGNPITSAGSASIDTKFYFADINGDGKDDKIYWNRDIFSGNIRVFINN